MASHRDLVACLSEVHYCRLNCHWTLALQQRCQKRLAQHTVRLATCTPLAMWRHQDTAHAVWLPASTDVRQRHLQSLQREHRMALEIMEIISRKWDPTTAGRTQQIVRGSHKAPKRPDAAQSAYLTTFLASRSCSSTFDLEQTLIKGTSTRKMSCASSP